MTPKQELALFRLVAKLIEEDFREEFARVYERILQVSGIHAFQPNNEMRNVLDHLSNVCEIIRTGKSRALHQTGNNVDDAEAEIERARRHINIAKYDGLTILLLNLEKGVTARLLIAEADHDQIFPEFNKRLGAIAKGRSQIPKGPEDLRGPKKKICKDNADYRNICDRLEVLVIQATDLLNDIDEGCPLKGGLLSRYPRIRKMSRFWRHHPMTTKIVGGLIVASIVYFVTNYLFPERVDWIGDKLADLIRSIIRKL